MLTDRFGRGVTDLRISVTNRCNFACEYCHDEGLGPVASPSRPHPEEMRPEEIDRIVSVAREYGIRSVKFTGGEPLVRSDLEEIIERTARRVDEVSLTTNGSMLADRAPGMRAAGLRRVNVSLDALDPAAFRRIRGGALPPVLRGIDAALAAGLTPVKLNSVVYRTTRPYLASLVDFVRARPGLSLQFIQYMPEWVGKADRGVPVAEIREWLAAQATRVQTREMHHRSVYRIGGTDVELVDPVNNPEFCRNCHRLRVTHRGELKGCLNRNDDLLPTRGLDLDGLRAAFRQVVHERVPYYGVYRPVGEPLLSAKALLEGTDSFALAPPARGSPGLTVDAPR
ncbi:MAG: GTP 3',8-cyclase MoaA [Thermoplasmata archaeon]